MSIEALNWAFKQDVRPMARKFVLVVLANYADENHSCFPGQETIARQIGASVETVRRAVIDLEGKGLLRRERRQRDDGYRTSDRYYLAVRLTGRPDLTGQSEESYRSDCGTLPVNLRELNHQVNHQSEPSVFSPVDDFPDWYDVYPRHEAKNKAKQAYVKARRSVSAEVLLDGAKRYATDPNRDPQFTKLPTTWLNAEGWADDPLPERGVPKAPEQPRAPWQFSDSNPPFDPYKDV